MGYIHTINISNDQSYLIEPLLFATAGGTSSALTAGINNFALAPGAYVHVKVGEVVANATLNVNNTGAIDIYYNNVQIGSDMLTSGNIYTFIYDGTYWDVLGDIAGQNIMIGTTTEWQSRSTYVAPQGTILVFTDHGTLTLNNGIVKTVPGIKISDGSTPCIDLPFVGDDVVIPLRNELNAHITNNVIHVTQQDKDSWNNKITCTDTVVENNLILTRN